MLWVKQRELGAASTVTVKIGEELQGKFITFEGTEGTGKTTQIRLLQEFLQAHGIAALVTREPGGTSVGEHVRSLLLETAAIPIDPRSELLLMFAARAQHLEEVIYPALHKGTWVLCDRFTDASYAYQGGGRGIPDAEIRMVESVVQGDFRPDLTILLAATLKTAMRRVSSRGKKDRFEREPGGFFERVQKAYLRLAEKSPGRIAVIDAELEIEEVAAEIRRVIQTRFSLQAPGSVSS